MKSRFIAVSVLLLAAACGSSPAAPTSAASTVTISGASAAAPATGTIIPYANQPVTLLATLPVTTPATTVTSVVDVASDSTFTVTVQSHTLSGNPGASVQVTLSALPSGTYYWRVRTIGPSEVNLSTASAFVISGTTAIEAPTLVTSDNVIVYPRPQLTVRRLAGATRPDGRIQYRFDVALTPLFLPVFRSTTVPETGGILSMYFDDEELPLATTFYWRVTAIDTVTGGSAVSGTQRFTTTPTTASSNAALFLTLDCRNPIPPISVRVPHVYTRAFDGVLSIAASTLRFTAGRSLVLTLAQAGSIAQGTINGAATERLGSYEAQVGTGFGQTNTPMPTTATLSPNFAEGSYDGYLGFYPVALDGDGCVSNNVRWKLYYR